MKLLATTLLLIGISCFNAKAQTQNIDGKFTLTGKLTGRDTGKLMLQYFSKDKKVVKDTAWLKDGKFVYSGFISDPQPAVIVGNVKSMWVNEPNLTTIFIEPADMKLSLVENDFKHAVLTGSRSQAEMDTLQNINAAQVNRSLDALEKEYDKYLDLRYKGDTSHTIQNKLDEIRNKILPYEEEKKLIIYAFVSNHPNSYISPYLLMYYIGRKKLPVDSAMQFYQAFTPQVKYSFYGNIFSDQIKALAVIKLGIGTPAPGFALTDINNKPLNLADYKSKSYVLIDFWASWCAPCRDLGPYLKSLYQKYHAKGFDIISLSIDEDSKAWKDAITKDQTNLWHHALTHNTGAADELPLKYGLTGVPALYLVDKDGLLIGIYEHSDVDKIEQDLSKRLKL